MHVESIWLINSFVIAKYIQQKKFKSYHQQLTKIKLVKRISLKKRILKYNLLHQFQELSWNYKKFLTNYVWIYNETDLSNLAEKTQWTRNKQGRSQKKWSSTLLESSRIESHRHLPVGLALAPLCWKGCSTHQRARSLSVILIQIMD